ncbi:MAG TPA: hypothetical protein VF788_09460, partial [Pseudonocardiaceae bacterium]
MSAPTPEELTFQPRIDGNPQSYFNFSTDGLYPITLPASKKEVLVMRDAKTVRLVMTDPRFSLAGLDPNEDTVTGTGYQSPSGMLRQDLPHIRCIRRAIIPFFSEQSIAPWREEVAGIADDLISKLLKGHRLADLNKRYFEPLVVRAVALSAGITKNESDTLY